MTDRFFRVGDRVEVHPGCNLWMMGARYGVITARMADGRLRVRMDHSQVKRAQYLPADRLQPQRYGPSIPWTYGDFK